MHNPKYILYVEDNNSDVELLKMSIERYCSALNVVLDVAETVEDGKLLFQSNKHVVVVTDCNLPDGGGLDVIEFIRKSNKNLPIFLVSGHFTDSNLSSAEKYNPISCLVKNYNQSFIEQIKKHLI